MPRREAAILDPIPGPVFRRGVTAVNRELAAIVQERMTAATGRPRAQTWVCLFTLLMIAAIDHPGSLLLTRAADVARRLSDEQKRRIGLSLGEDAYWQVQRAVADLERALTERVDETTGEILPTRLGMSVAEFTTAMAGGPVPAQYRTAPSVAIDSTDGEAYARRRSHGRIADRDAPSNEPGFPRLGADGRLRHTIDPDATTGYRSGKNLLPKSTFNGWDIHLATPVSEMGEESMAPLVTGVVLAPAGSYKADAGIALIDALTACWSRPATVLVDRGYSYLDSAAWALPLANRDIAQVFDLHTNQRLVRPGPIPGTIWVDGGLFSDALPESLRRLPPYTLKMTATDRALLAQRYDQRIPYAFSTQGRPNAQRATQRYRGPALASKVRCPNVPTSMRLDPSTRPTTACAPSACACGTTVTLGPQDELGTRQRALWGTTAWKASYGRRSGVESANASARWHHGRLDRGSVRLKGTTRTAIAYSFILAANNVRVLLACYGWDIGDPLCPAADVRPLPSPSRALHRTHRYLRTRRAPASGPPPSPAPHRTGEWLRPADIDS